MKLKVRTISFLVLLVLVASSIAVYASEVEIQKVQPQVISYCNTASGLHEGIGGGMEKFYDKSKLPSHIYYPGIFGAYTCTGCGETVYIYDYLGLYQGNYFFSNAISIDNIIGGVGYKMVDPNLVYTNSTLQHWKFSDY